MPHHRHRSPHPLPTNTPSTNNTDINRAHLLAPVLFCVGITGESGVSKTPCPPIRLRARLDEISGCSKGNPKMGNVFFRSDFCGDHWFIWIYFIGRWPMAIFWKAGCWLSVFVFRQIGQMAGVGGDGFFFGWYQSIDCAFTRELFVV